MRWRASSCGWRAARTFIFPLWIRDAGKTISLTRVKRLSVFVLCACSSCCCGGGHKGAVERASERAQLTACVIDIFASMCAQFPNTCHTDEAPERAPLPTFLYCKEDFCRAAALIIKRAHTHNNNNMKNIYVHWVCGRVVVLKLAAIYQQQVSPLNTHLWLARRAQKAKLAPNAAQAIAPRWCRECPIYNSRWLLLHFAKWYHCIGIHRGYARRCGNALELTFSWASVSQLKIDCTNWCWLR